MMALFFEPAPSFATGFYGPLQYLDNGGKNVDLSPEFYWELEVKRLAGNFHPTEKLLLTKIDDSQTDSEGKPIPEENPKRVATADADLKDFDQAIQEGRIKPSDPVKARDAHKAGRDLIARTDDKTTEALPEEFESEFSDYHKGASAYRRGKEHWDESRKAWERLLQRPESERKNRTVWAAFMLGKIAIKTGSSEAVTWFQRTREFAKAGFTDSLGMAADSYGWEGRSEWKQNHPEKAAPLFLTQLALGDTSAIVSLKALIPDRSSVEGMLNYGPEIGDIDKLTVDQKNAKAQKAISELRSAAKDPLLRSLVTAHILATESVVQGAYSSDGGSQAGVRCARWLSVIKEANLTQVDEAEYLGWVAYNSGNYNEADRWLQLAKINSPAACWLRAKLQRRSGRLDEAAKSMALAWQSIHDLSHYTGWSGTTEDRYLTGYEEGAWTFDSSASGDFGGLRLERGDFVQALETFWRGGLWDDAAYVGEHVLSADELKAFVDQQPDSAGTTDDTSSEKRVGNLKYLLGRRLVREDRYEEAARYLKPPYDKVLGIYVRALKEGADEKLSKEERARAWFTAGWLARYDGMELMGTEASPDGFDYGGAFENVDLAKQRSSGFWSLTTYVNGKETIAKVPLLLKPSKQEAKRLGQYRTMPDVRFHYRIIAGALAVRAAGLLPNDTPELADVMNSAGRWVASRDDKIANRYYQLLETRCANTDIGRSAISRRWFVDNTGPWSEEQAAKRAAMRQKLGIKDE
jgi:tetratricopeptide (TPR) repeat protein